MEKSNISETEFQLHKLFIKYSDLFVYHQWPSEHARWVELIFLLVSRISNKPEYEVREAIEECDDLGLLDINELSKVPYTKGAIDMDSPHAKRIVELLSESGFIADESKRSILVMHEAAKSLKEHNDGKVQKYLRKYGQLMIDELSENFSFSELNENDVIYAFTYWFQNVLNMPVSSNTEGIDAFCKRFRITDEEFMKEADDLDINLALLDDMIERDMNDSRGGENKGE